MELEEIINKLKGISSILCSMSECPLGVIWQDNALCLLNEDLVECIKELDCSQ